MTILQGLVILVGIWGLYKYLVCCANAEVKRQNLQIPSGVSYHAECVCSSCKSPRIAKCVKAFIGGKPLEGAYLTSTGKLEVGDKVVCLDCGTEDVYA